MWIGQLDVKRERYQGGENRCARKPPAAFHQEAERHTEDDEEGETDQNLRSENEVALVSDEDNKRCKPQADTSDNAW